MRNALYTRPLFTVAHHTCTGEERRYDLLLRCDRYYVVDPSKATPERVAAWKSAPRQETSVGTGSLRHLAKAVGEEGAEEAAIGLLAEVDCPRFTRMGLEGLYFC